MNKAGRTGAGTSGARDPAPRERGGCVVAFLLALAAFIGLAGLRRRAPAGAGGTAPDPASLRAGHELRDMTPRQAILALGMLLAAIFALFVIVTVFTMRVVGPNGSFLPIKAVVANAPNVQPPPAPRLETTNGQVLEELHAKEDALLNNYAWIDQKAGTVRIPIDRAIELLVQRGLPTRAQPPGSTPGVLTRPESSSSGRTQEETIP